MSVIKTGTWKLEMDILLNKLNVWKKNPENYCIIELWIFSSTTVCKLTDQHVRQSHFFSLNRIHTRRPFYNSTEGWKSEAYEITEAGANWNELIAQRQLNIITASRLKANLISLSNLFLFISSFRMVIGKRKPLIDFFSIDIDVWSHCLNNGKYEVLFHKNEITFYGGR